MGYFTTADEWKDVQPIPQDEGGPSPLAAIAYPEDYAEAMSYLRAVMADNEMSERALQLTETIIGANPAHYTVWLYRARIILAMNYDLRKEIEWLNPTALRNLKNYQIWHHRQTMIENLGSADGEQAFVASMLEKDTKNYHVWSYRQWLVRRFDLWDQGELEAVESLIKDDVRNNSAWNHRWFVVFGGDEGNFKNEEILEREIAYAQDAIRLAPQNQSPWNYLRGLIRHAKLPASKFQNFAEEFATLEKPDDISSSHALDLLADIYAEEQDRKSDAAKALDLLAMRFDPIRQNYWNYRKSLLGPEEVEAAA
ncbi:protein prenylyltransferase [Saccharata proteae CBS 121410]|uniref:Protein farnesyltransferase/geranylgeranyltransferase type-1 subunit alpha n=1 Tax=Saccharata proteae CBS 121410 TaxID=1314787 RepID=A0A9P4I0E8_9PEZI|nr:protein prenylyltransferase [Saccharata proteae CBS 121410]